MVIDKQNITNILNKTDINIDADFIKRKVSKIQRELKNAHQNIKASDLIINVVFGTRQENRYLNKKYRKKNIECTVLTFIYPRIDEDNIIADIVINIQYLKELYPKELFEEKLDEVLVHAILHVYGFDHITDDLESRMESIQEKILQILNHKQKNSHTP